MILGATLGVLVALAIVAHLGPGNSWLINVALAKLTLIATGGLMSGGAVAIRLDNRERLKQLRDRTDRNTTV
jgi:hypothetical protein